jgi:hypothetical protein
MNASSRTKAVRVHASQCVGMNRIANAYAKLPTATSDMALK